VRECENSGNKHAPRTSTLVRSPNARLEPAELERGAVFRDGAAMREWKNGKSSKVGREKCFSALVENNTEMRILHIVAGMPPGSGIAAVVTPLAKEQQRMGCVVAIATTEVGGRRSEVRGSASANTASAFAKATADKTADRQRTEIGEVVFQQCWPKAVYFSWAMLRGLGKEVREADVVHVHGCWTFPVWWGAWLALRYQKTLVMSPHGSFNPLQLQHSAWKKRLVGWMDRWLLRRASVIHATCEAENAWVQAFLQAKRESSSAKATADEKLKAKREEVGEQRSEVGGQRSDGMPKIVVIPNGVGGVGEVC